LIYLNKTVKQKSRIRIDFMMLYLRAGLLTALLSASAVAHSAPDAAAPATVAAVAPIVPRALAGAKIELMIINEVTTKTAKPGDRFLLKLAQPLVVDDRILIPRGVSAWGEVSNASANGIAGRSGKLGTRLLYIDFNGQHLPISGAPTNKGQGGNLQIVLATLAFTPWGLVAKGNNAKLKAGDIVPGYLVDAYPVAEPSDAGTAAAPVIEP
jgi:outer membrane receptor protein involved in Fe transport